MATETRVHDPAVGFRFQVSARAGAVLAGFSKVTGLRDESESAEYREGTDPLVKTQVPGLRTFPALVLERGMMAKSDALIAWRRDAIKCKDPFRSDVKITVYNCDKKAARSVEFQNAWPNALAISDLDGGSSEVNIESVELKHEGKVQDTIFAPGGVEFPKDRGGRG